MPGRHDTSSTTDHVDTDTESVRSSVSGVSTHSSASVLVDMGKVVGVLRSYPPDDELEDDSFNVSDFEIPEDNFLSDSSTETSPEARECVKCAQQNKSQDSEHEDSLLGDPLVYATFVATVQQYSTETEPSRQPSFNSRQPSFNSKALSSSKQNSSEVDASAVTIGQFSEAVVSNRLEVPKSDDTRDIVSETHVTRDTRDIYATRAQMSGTQVQDTVSEVSTADLNDQVNQERLSFIHSQVILSATVVSIIIL